jgi:hypothetical protein
MVQALEGYKMKKAPVPTKIQGAFQDHTRQADSIKPAYFLGTDNPRHLRAIHALWVSPQPRESIDSRAGCSNGPDLVAELRRRGLDVPCEKTPCIDRDGFEVKRGIYFLTKKDRKLIRRWKNKRQKGG